MENPVQFSIAGQLRFDVGPGLDVMGDGHGLLASRIKLIEKAGYIRGSDGLFRHPAGRKLVYLNDESSRGFLPDLTVEFGEYPSIAMLNLMKRQVQADFAVAVDSNHNYKVWRWLLGRNVKMSHGDERVVEEFNDFEKKFGFEKTSKFKTELGNFLMGLPSHLVLVKEGIPRAVVVHAGIHDDMIGRENQRIINFCRFGPTNGFLENGKPNRLDWTIHHKNALLIIWGHVPHLEPVLVRNTINIDQGGFYGHYLTLLRYPEMEILQERVPQCFVPPQDNPFLNYASRQK
jgi:hypothetical protein